MFKRPRLQAVEDLETFDVAEEAREVEERDGDKKTKNVLGILKSQRERSIGFDNDKELNLERADALDYYKGKHDGAIARDLPVPTGRSTVVSTEVANAVEAALPDIIEIFVAGDDVITFKPQGLEDVAAAQQESEYVRHIIFVQNRGFFILYTMIKDALISKTGIVHFYWDGKAEYEEYQTTASEPQIDEIVEMGNELITVEPTGTVTAQNFPLFHVTFRKQCSDGHVAIKNVAPEDFTVSPETIILADTDYCAMRSRRTRQWLIEEGYKKADVMKLDMSEDDDNERIARDAAEENLDPQGSEGDKMMELVDIVVHYVRLDLDGTGEAQIWRIVTGNNEAIELDREKRARIEFAAITPYPMTHRFYGQSTADKTIQTQKWKTSITRTANDHLYFANNQRQEIKRAGIVPGVTIPQLTDNKPGQPVITEDGNSLRPIQNGSLGIDVLGLLGYISADNEERTGIARNTMGLPSDAMHETKGGNDKLISLSQKRHRMMARLFAETGIKDLYLGIHDTARSNATMKDTVELTGGWVEIAPSGWRRRKDATIEIGVGSGGAEAALAGIREFRGLMSEVVQAQGGLDSKDGLVTKQSVYDFSQNYGKKLGVKAAPMFLNDPKRIEEEKAAKAAAGVQEEPEVPPEVAQAQMELEVEKQTQAARIQLETQKAQTQAQIDMAKLKAKADLDREQMRADMALAKERAGLELQMQREKAAAELQLAREKAAAELQFAREKAKVEADLAREKAEFEADLAELNAQRENELAHKEIDLTAQNDREDSIRKNRPGGSLAE